VKLNLHKKSSTEGDHHDEGKTAVKTTSFSFKPPPAAGSTVFSNLPVPPKEAPLSSFSPQSNTTAESNTVTNDDDWGDFTA
jgi:hypothetical protein